MIAQTKGVLANHRRKVLPALISLSLLAGVVTSIIATQGAQADYYVGCGFGYTSNGSFGYGTGFGYGYDSNNNFVYGDGNQVCPPAPNNGGGGGATTTTTSTTTTTTTLTTTTTSPTTTTTLRKKPVPQLLGLHVYFANNSAVLTKYYQNEIASLAGEIRADHTTHITITGYASKIGNNAINFPLSRLRAETVKNFLFSLLEAHGYTSISFTVSGNGVLRTFANLALDRVVVLTS
jgi:outer membrane protein OmpA-like peptidoglycan-associated protein